MPLLDINLAALPTSGAAWLAIKARADGTLGAINLSDQNLYADVNTLACALVAVRTGSASHRTKAEQALRGCVNTDGNYGLAAFRNLPSTVIAADVLGFRESAFVNYIAALEKGTRPLKGRSDFATLADSSQLDPTNWGTHARAAHIACRRYLGLGCDGLAMRFNGYLGSASDFRWDGSALAVSWQPSPQKHACLPVGTTKQGVNLSGCLPEDARRGGAFAVPVPQSNYTREAMQGIVLAAELLHVGGLSAYEYQDKAVLRAFRWITDVQRMPWDSDDSWTPWLIRHRYGASAVAGVPLETPTSPGKNFGFADWLYAGQAAPTPPPPVPPSPTDPCAGVKAELNQTKADLAAANVRVQSLTAKVDAAKAALG